MANHTTNERLATLERRVDSLRTDVRDGFKHLQERLDEHIDWGHQHETNHHGRASTAKQTGLTSVLAGLLVVAVEVARRMIF